LDIPHGPDGAFRNHKGSIALTPKNLDKSELWQRLNTEDKDDLMPPIDSHKKQLNSEEKELIKNWILQGAKWESHWSFSAPEQKNLTVKKHPWIINEIDNFVLEKLENKGLSPRPQAPKYSLIRRVSLDLTGLPPSPEEVANFLGDNSEQAYETMLNHYFDSPHYGERMAQAWMDAARYGDTSVFHADGPRTMWPWRDWVINAYNQNISFAEFTKLQLAGDYYENEAADPARIATAFLRNNGTTDEGGAFPEEYRVEYAIDRLATTSKIWLGLSVECAQCHDHKYDPITQEEFYQLYAFFNVSADGGMQTRRGNATPTKAVPLIEEEQQTLEQLNTKLAALANQLKEHKLTHLEQSKQWLQKTASETSPVLGNQLTHYYPLDERSGKIVTDPILNQNSGQLEGVFQTTAKNDKHLGLKLDGKTNFKIDHVGDHIEFNQPFSYGAWVKISNNNGFQVPFARMDTKNQYRGFDLFYSTGYFGVHLINSWPQNAIKVQSKEKIPDNKWVHLFITYDGSAKASGLKLYVDAKEQAYQVLNDTLNATLKANTPFRIGRREVDHPYLNEIDDIRLYSKQCSQEEIKHLMNFETLDTVLSASLQHPNLENKYLEDHYFNQVDHDYKNIVKQQSQQQDAKKELEGKNVMVMQDLPGMRKTYVLNRGQYDQPITEKEIEMGVPAIFPPMAEDWPKNRLGLAQWILDEKNPLTARVTVNRYWSMLFGEGLVSSVTDFGSQGSWPTHPELLDWLAVEFRKNNWDIKNILKKIMMSATYRQDSRATPELIEIDAQNHLLARGPRFRLQGEFIRDLALKASGLLVTTLGGEGVKPYQPPGLWREVALGGKDGIQFVQDQGDKNYRRSLYTYWKRSAPPPNMLTFDAPTREKCLVQRSRTNTPLQALVTLNDPQFVEMARVFGQSIMNSTHTSLEQKIDYAYTWVTSHPPEASIREEIIELYKNRLELFRKNPERVQSLLQVGSAPIPQNLDPSEIAAWSIIGSLLLNLDETLTKG